MSTQTSVLAERSVVKPLCRANLRKPPTNLDPRTGLPKWVEEFALYQFHLPDELDRDVVRVTKRGQDPYVFNRDGYCCCRHKRCGGDPRATECRHEQMARAIRAYMQCPRCGQYEAPHTRLTLCADWRGGYCYHYLACRECERVGGMNQGAESWHKEWLGGFLTPYEVRLIDALLTITSAHDRDNLG